jgi:hypothetical protein
VSGWTKVTFPHQAIGRRRIHWASIRRSRADFGYSDLVQFAPRDRFHIALTSYLGVEGQDLYSRDGVLFQDSAIRFADITDGASNTLLAGERPASADF